ncbi:hypothetical protein NST58_01045 [Paenibacillus sp. FSL R10-2796]|uniref:hypothetical protein n=1 Tax=Paenibacillus sp. FSL R10-2796 TaxID=2954663 RepID=UPI0030D85178
MKFTIFVIEGKSDFHVLKSMNDTFSNDELTLFHFNDLNQKIAHAVFNIKDEYLFGTKLSGNHINVPMNQYINTFYNKSLRLLFIENINEKYSEEIAKYLRLNSIQNRTVNFNNQSILNITSHYGGFIKKVDLDDELDEDHITYESKSVDSLRLELESNNNLTINYLLMLVKDHFISLSSKGQLSVNNSTLKFLTEFIEEFPYAENY